MIAGISVSASEEVKIARLLVLSEKNGLTTSEQGYPYSESTKITATVKDRNGNPIDDDLISWSIEPNLSHIEAEFPTTN